MALTNYKPAFPYKGNQVIISSGRVVAHSKDDAIFLFGKKAVGISTPGTFNVDATKGVTINAPTIELGIGASQEGVGEPVVKGKALITQLTRLIDQIQALSESLQHLRSSRKGFARSLPLVINKAKLLSDAATSVKNQLASILSTVTNTL